MKIKLLVLLVCVLISLPGVATAVQSLDYQRQSEQAAAVTKAQSEHAAAVTKAQAEHAAAVTKAQAEHAAAVTKAQFEHAAVVTKAQSEHAAAVNADNGIVNKIYSFLKTGLLENIYKLFQGGPSTPAQYPSGGGAVTDMGITIIENSPEIAQNQKNVTDAQKRWIPEAVELCRDGLPMEEILMLAPGVQGGELFFPKQRLTSVIKNEAIKQGITCKE
ncbi:hypothetical protein MGMO_85c00440 [Methyloglobulus morosus KoM1]|uniref:Uncharacterized protein n=1 Tax=Methyloglobulus morosus KoM1 TaxID=1116472 RepID=V5BVL6_9GAMM|nr:hypothetical protein [Methyloglobulus morosus]ESS71919.1 hypothetical protein MGMO_85c00440 [Methyloglobulus morosus KoM1]